MKLDLAAVQLTVRLIGFLQTRTGKRLPKQMALLRGLFYQTLTHFRHTLRITLSGAWELLRGPIGAVSPLKIHSLRDQLIKTMFIQIDLSFGKRFKIC